MCSHALFTKCRRRSHQLANFNSIIDVKTAKQIGLTLPPSVLARADRDQVKTIVGSRQLAAKEQKDSDEQKKNRRFCRRTTDCVSARRCNWGATGGKNSQNRLPERILRLG
jgi:hypothetical protein